LDEPFLQIINLFLYTGQVLVGLANVVSEVFKHRLECLNLDIELLRNEVRNLIKVVTRNLGGLVGLGTQKFGELHSLRSL